MLILVSNTKITSTAIGFNQWQIHNFKRQNRSNFSTTLCLKNSQRIKFKIVALNENIHNVSQCLLLDLWIPHYLIVNLVHTSNMEINQADIDRMSGLNSNNKSKIEHGKNKWRQHILQFQ